MSVMSIVTDLIQLSSALPLEHGLILAQFQNVDILGNIQMGWADFLQTGKASAAVIGLVLGYMIRGITR